MPDRGLAGRFVEGLLRSRRLVADVPLLVRGAFGSIFPY